MTTALRVTASTSAARTTGMSKFFTFALRTTVLSKLIHDANTFDYAFRGVERVASTLQK